MPGSISNEYEIDNPALSKIIYFEFKNHKFFQKKLPLCSSRFRQQYTVTIQNLHLLINI